MYFRILILIVLFSLIGVVPARAANITATLDEAAGSSVFAVKDSAATEQGYILVSDLAMVDVSDEDGFGFPKHKFNAVISDPQPKFFEMPSFQLNHFSMLQRMIQLADLLNLSHNVGLFFDGQTGEFFLSGGMKEVIEHKRDYLNDFRRFLSRFSTSWAGIHEPAWSASLTRASVSLMDSGEESSIKSTTSSNNSLERTLEGAITPRRFLSSMMVKGKDLLIIFSRVQKVKDNFHGVSIKDASENVNLKFVPGDFRFLMMFWGLMLLILSMWLRLTKVFRHSEITVILNEAKRSEESQSINWRMRFFARPVRSRKPSFRMTQTLVLVTSLIFLTLAPSAHAANITATLDEAAGSSVFAVNDSAAVEQCHVDSDGNAVFKGCLRVDSGGAECTVTEGLVIDGNVGIGTTGPAGLLHVSSDTAATGLSYFTQANASADGFDQNFRKARGTGAAPTVITTADELGVINFTGYGGAAGYITGAAIKGISSGTIADSRVPGQLSFWTGTNAAPSVLTERVTIDNAGNVGIGTTGPDLRLGQKLDIATSANYGGISLSTWTTTGAQAPIIDLKKSASATIGTHTLVSNGDILGHLVFRGSDGTVFADAGYIKMEVDGTPGASDMPGRMIFLTSADGSGSPTERMRITSTGNLGIGTTGPTQTLHIAGTARLTTSVAVTDDRTLCTIAASGEIEIKDGACGTSSRRYKENIERLGYGLNEINLLNPVFFNQKNFDKQKSSTRTKRRIGFVAEEVQPVIPEVVIFNEEGLVDGVDYAYLVVLLTKGIQELDAIVRGGGTVYTPPAKPGAAPLEGGAAEGGAQGLVVSSSSGVPATPAKGQAVIYMKEDGNLYFKNDVGEEKLLSGSRWTPAENGIFYSGGPVGIGLEEKLSALTVRPPSDKTILGKTVGSKGAQIEGVGTRFLSELGIGDRIALSSDPSAYATVMAIDSDTLLSVDQPLGKGFSTNQTISKKSSLFRLEDAEGDVKFLVNDLGWIGIGTAAPQAPLHVSRPMKIYDPTPQTGVTSLKLNPGEGQGKAALLEIQDEKGDSTVTVDAAGKMGIGTFSPESALHVAPNQYAQFEHNQKGAPPEEDCKEDHQRGRLSIDTKNNRLYICNGAKRGWDFVGLSD